MEYLFPARVKSFRDLAPGELALRVRGNNYCGFRCKLAPTEPEDPPTSGLVLIGKDEEGQK